MSILKFDRRQSYGDIFHGGEDGNAALLPRFFQNGHYFRPDGSYHSSDGQPRRKVVEPPAPPAAERNTIAQVTEAEVPELLKDPRAEELLELTRDHLAELITAANGPLAYGEGSTQIMVAWLIKNTKPDGAVTATPAAPPIPVLQDLPPDGRPLQPGDTDEL